MAGDVAVTTTVAALTEHPVATMMVMPEFSTTLLEKIQTGQTEVAIDGSPVIEGSVPLPGAVSAATDGSAWFVPELQLARRDRSSRVPMVAFSNTADGWQLRIGIDRVLGQVPEETGLLPVTDYAVQMNSSVAGFVPPTFTVTREPSPDPHAVDRLVVTAPVDLESMVKAMRSADTSLQVTAVVHYRTTPPATPPPTDPGPRVHRFPRRIPRRWLEQDVELQPGELPPHLRARLTPSPQVVRYAARPIDTMLVSDDIDLARYIDVTHTADPTVTTQPVTWLPINFFFDPTAIAYYRPIYAGLPGIDAGDDGSVWASTVTGYWRAAQTYSVYNVVPDEYRLAFDDASDTPAMSVLLRELPVDPNSPHAGYSVRVRFRIVPWVEPKRRLALQSAIARSEFVPFPQLVVGGYQSASFDMTTFLSGLGADTVSAADGIDPNGFELVWDCTLEFYTFLCSQLAPSTPTDATAVEGRVRLTLRMSGEDGSTPTTVDVPVRLSLNAIAGDLTNTSLLPLPARELWPDDWAPDLYAAVSPRTTGLLDTQILGGSLVALGADGQPVGATALTATPAALTLNGPDPVPVPAPTIVLPPPPRFPGDLHENPGVVSEDVRAVQTRLSVLGYQIEIDGDFGDQTEGFVRDYQDVKGLPATGVVDAETWRTLFDDSGRRPPPWPPAAPPGSVLVRLAPAAAGPDPGLIGAAELVFGQPDLHIDRVRTLERIHSLAAASPLSTAVTVSSYQLAHPDDLPAAHSRIFALDCEIRRDDGDPVSVTITRDAPSADTSVPFTFVDLVAGMRPDQPRFAYRVRYQEPEGAGPWSDWTSFAGTQLRITPAG